jgi:hypothetical protein
MSSTNVEGKRQKKKSFSLEGLKEAREGGGGLDDYEVEDDEDVYDLVDEDKYASIVESRRKQDDFVVDDSKYIVAFDLHTKLRAQAHTFSNPLFHALL